MRTIGRLGGFGPRSDGACRGMVPRGATGIRAGDPAGRRGVLGGPSPAAARRVGGGAVRACRAGPSDGRDHFHADSLRMRRPPRLREGWSGRRLHGARERDGPQEPPPRDGTHLDRPERVAGGRAIGSSSSAACGRGTRRRLDWDDRGYEQGAEIMAWALGDRILTAQIPDNDPAQLGAAFELLTGVVVPLALEVATHAHARLTGCEQGLSTVRRSGWGRAACPAASRGSRRPDTRTGRRSSGRSAATAGHRCAGSSRTRTCARSCGSARSAR